MAQPIKLSSPWPGPNLPIYPATAARRLATTLTSRDVENIGLRDERGVSLVSVPLTWPNAMNIWVGPKCLAFTDTDGNRIRRPFIDLQDVAEHLVRRIEEDREQQ